MPGVSCLAVTGLTVERLLEEGAALARVPSLRLCRSCLLLHLLLLLSCRLRDGGTKVDLLEHQPYVHPLVLAIAQASPDEVLRLSRDGGFVWELDVAGLEDGVLLEDGGLALVVSKGLLAVQTLVKYHSHTPYIHFGGNFGRGLAHHKAFRRQVPISAGPLASEVHPLLRVVVVLVHNLRQTKVSDLYVAGDYVDPAGKKDVTRFEIIVNNGRFDLVEILEGGHNLHDDAPCLPLRNRLVLFQVKVKIVSITVLQNGAEAVGVYLEDVEQLDNASVLQCLVDVILPQSMLYVVCLFVVLPVLVELVNLAGHVPLLLHVEPLVYLTKPS